MSSETITRNDLTNILNEVLPPTPSEYRKLLWTNPSPTSLFSGQTISLDLSKYDEVCICFVCWTSVQEVISSVNAPVGTSGRAFSPLAVSAYRSFSTSATGITFGNASAYTSYGAWSEGTQNNACVPWKIYGIKYERVNPPVIDDATISNDVLSFGNLRVFRGTTNVPYSGWADIVYPTGTFSVVLAEIPYCAQGGFGAASTVSTSNAHLTDKAQVFQFNTAGASMQVGIITIGLA